MVALTIGVFLVTGCGDKAVDKPLPATKRAISVRLPWGDGQRIPRRYTCDGGSHVPAVSTSAEPADRVAIVMTDPDAPGGTFVHWTHWGANTEGRNSFGRTGYSGPCPPKGDAPHHYVVTVYLLRKPLSLAAGAAPDAVLAAIGPIAVARGSQTGTYGR